MPLYREKWSGSQSTDFIVNLAALCVPFYYLLYFHVDKLSFPLKTTSLPSFGEFCFGDIETGLLKFTKYWCQYWQKKNGLDGYKFLLDSSQESPTLHDPMDCTLPGSSVHGILQARVLEWVAIAFSELQPMGLQRVRHNLSTEHTLRASWHRVERDKRTVIYQRLAEEVSTRPRS